eukprot:COSAG06_NODE_9687_length_1844_cov_1.590258_4_plen_79_part_00
MKLLEAEMEELEDEGDNLVQERRMAEKEKNDIVLERADAAEAHAALLENGALTMPCTAQETEEKKKNAESDESGYRKS